MANLSRNLSSRAKNKRRSDHHEKRIKVGKPTQGDQGAVANSGRTETVLADAPTVDELRRARADYYSKAPEERKRAATAGMVYVSETRSTVARAESTSKAEATDNIRRRKHSHRSDRHHRSRKEHRDGDGEAPIYVYGNPNEEASSAAAGASSPPLHSQIGGKTSSDLSRARTHKAGDSRSHRHSERRRSSEGHLREARPVYASRSSNAPDPHGVPPLRRSKTRSNHYTATVEEIKPPKVTR